MESILTDIQILSLNQVEEFLVAGSQVGQVCEEVKFATDFDLDRKRIKTGKLKKVFITSNM